MFSVKKKVFVFFKQRFANFVKTEKNKVLRFLAFQIFEVASVLRFPKTYLALDGNYILDVL
jgi:hypothetical protein